MDLTSRCNTVVGQNQRHKTVVLNYLFHPLYSLSFIWADNSSEALNTPNGITVSPAQSDSTVELGLRWLF